MNFVTILITSINEDLMVYTTCIVEHYRVVRKRFFLFDLDETDSTIK